MELLVVVEEQVGIEKYLIIQFPQVQSQLLLEQEEQAQHRAQEVQTVIIQCLEQVLQLHPQQVVAEAGQTTPIPLLHPQLQIVTGKQ